MTPSAFNAARPTRETAFKVKSSVVPKILQIVEAAPQNKPYCAAELRRCRAECPFVTRCSAEQISCGEICCIRGTGGPIITNGQYCASTQPGLCCSMTEHNCNGVCCSGICTGGQCIIPQPGMIEYCRFKYGTQVLCQTSTECGGTPCLEGCCQPIIT